MRRFASDADAVQRLNGATVCTFKASTGDGIERLNRCISGGIVENRGAIFLSHGSEPGSQPLRRMSAALSGSEPLKDAIRSTILARVRFQPCKPSHSSPSAC